MTIDYEGLANAALIIITGLLGWFGIRKGLKVSETPSRIADTPQLRLDMAMVDNRALDALGAAIETLNHTLGETNAMLQREISEREMDEEVERRVKERLGKP